MAALDGWRHWAEGAAIPDQPLPACGFGAAKLQKFQLCRLVWCRTVVGRVAREMKVVGDPGIEPGVRLREGVTVPCHTLRPVAH